jgi:hypothetical protein
LIRFDYLSRYERIFNDNRTNTRSDAAGPDHHPPASSRPPPVADVDQSGCFDVAPSVCRFVMRLLALFHGNDLKPADFRFTQDTLGWLMMCAGVGEIRTDAVTGKRRPVFKKPVRH